MSDVARKLKIAAIGDLHVRQERTAVRGGGENVNAENNVSATHEAAHVSDVRQRHREHAT